MPATKCRSGRPQVFLEKVVLKICSKANLGVLKICSKANLGVLKICSKANLQENTHAEVQFAKQLY